MFTFDKHSEHTTFIQFVAAAASKDPTRETIQHIYVPGNGCTDIVAMDGHRCHIYTPDTSPLQPGLYQIVKKTKKEIILNWTDPDTLPDYPEYKRIIPEAKNLVEFTSLSGALDQSKIYTQVVRAMDASVSLDFNLFKDIPPGLFQEFQVGDSGGPVLFCGSMVQAVIMPFRM